MFKPNLFLERVTDITPEMLNEIGVKALLLDVDNTLSTHHGTELTEGLMDWISYMQSSGIPLLVFSNSKDKRVRPFAEKIGLPYMSLGLKPLPFGYFRGAKRLGLKRKEIALCGDQFFTDLLGAKTTGTKIILLKPILLEDKWSFKVRRYLERKIYKGWGIN